MAYTSGPRRGWRSLLGWGDPSDLLGLPPPAARRLTRTLRGEVTDTVASLLPGLHTTTGARWVEATGLALLRSVPILVAQVEPTIPEPLRASACFPAAMLQPIADELTARRSGVGGVARPSDRLRSTRPDTSGFVARALALYVDVATAAELREQRVDLVRSLVPDRSDQAAGAWAVYASAMALSLHRNALPEPGRTADRQQGERATTARSAGLAFHLGRTLLLDTAIGLLERSGE